jgi:hypothetical protein
MTISRRGLFQAGAITVAGLGGYFILNGNTRTAIQAHLEEVFGADIAAHPDTAAFVNDFMAGTQNRLGDRFWQLSAYYRAKPQFLPPLTEDEQRIMDEVVQKFLQSTNVVKSFEENVEFKYIAMFDPHHRPCSNQMSSLWM